MPVEPLPASLHVSEFYERKRRLAYHFAWLSMTLLLVQLAVGFVPNFFGQPRPAISDGGLSLFYRCLSPEETDTSRFLVLDSAMKPKGEPLHLLDNAGAVLLEGPDTTVFYGSRVSLLTDGKNARAVELGQTWDVLSVLRDPGREAVWIFGWNEGRIVARRREHGLWGPEVPVAPSGIVERLSSSLEGSGGPLVSWREKDSKKVRSSIYDGRDFVPRPEFEIGDSQFWDTALAQGRVLLIYYHRDDRHYDAVTLRVECCPGCASPLPPHKIQLADPVLLFGRKITGLGMLLTGERLRLFLTRPTRIVWTSLPAATVEPEPGAAKLQVLEVHSLWRNVIGSITPTLLLFCSAALIFLGLTLLRERSRVVTTPSTPEPAEAALSARSMAYLLDLILLWPVFVAAVGVLDFPVDDLNDPRFLWILLLGAGIEFVYHFAMEWGLGWTIGKRIIGLRVTGVDGERLSCQGALLRNLVRLVDGTLPFSWILGISAMLRTKRSQRLGDFVGRTVVVRE
jgi:uncharacterized RDD family membrane protein YckC